MGGGTGTGGRDGQLGTGAEVLERKFCFDETMLSVDLGSTPTLSETAILASRVAQDFELPNQGIDRFDNPVFFHYLMDIRREFGSDAEHHNALEPTDFIIALYMHDQKIDDGAVTELIEEIDFSEFMHSIGVLQEAKK